MNTILEIDVDDDLVEKWMQLSQVLGFSLEDHVGEIVADVLKNELEELATQFDSPGI